MRAFGLNANVVAVAQGSIQVLRYDVHQKHSATTTQMWTIITLQSAQTKATVSAQSYFDAMFVFNITRSWRDLSTQENFRRKEKFEVKIFQLSTMIFSENFLSVEIFLEWKWSFMTCRGRTILRTLCPKPIECLVFCSDGVPCDIQKTLYISLVMSHLIYARPSIVTLSAWIYSLETRRRGTGTTRNRRFKQPI